MRLGLSARTILVLLAAGLVPLGLAGVAALSRLEEDLVKAMLDDQRRMIAQIQLDFDAELSWYAGQLEALAGQVQVASLAAEPARRALDHFLTYHAVFQDVSLYDTDRRQVTRASRAPASGAPAPVLPAALERSFAAALEGKLRSGSAGAVGSPDERLDVYLLVAVPSLRLNAAPVGVLAGRVPRQGAEIQGIVDAWRFVGEAYVYITTPDGEVVAHAGAGPRGRVRRLRVGGGAARSAGSAGAITAGIGRVLDRDDVIATAPLGGHGLVAVVGRPYAQVRRALDELLWSVSFRALVGVLFALLLGVLLSRAVVAPILSLTDGIQRVARGEVAYRLPVDRGDELGDAAGAFNDMAAQLQKGRLLEDLWQERRRGLAPEAP